MVWRGIPFDLKLFMTSCNQLAQGFAHPEEVEAPKHVRVFRLELIQQFEITHLEILWKSIPVGLSNCSSALSCLPGGGCWVRYFR